MYIFGLLLSVIVPKRLVQIVSSLCNHFRAGWYLQSTKYVHSHIVLLRGARLLNSELMQFGNNCSIDSYTTMEAYIRKGYPNSPKIIVGEGVTIGSFCHITAVNQINIGDNVLLGKYITITDNSHGSLEFEQLNKHPSDRDVYSKGPVMIEDCVWIGDKVTILPNVRIGRGSIIGANTVVTKDVPPYSVCVGNPGKIIRKSD